MTETTSQVNHPCFNEKARSKAARVHLPVAGRCNISCNYCDRKYDCLNESRPGVTSTLMQPTEALFHLRKVLQMYPQTTVVGIAGPGEPFATPETTLETLERVRREFPELLLCVASNGFGILPHIDSLAEVGVSHVTVTINAVDPEIGALIYPYVSEGKVVFWGRAAAELLVERQLNAVAALKARGMTVKVNTVVVPGINDQHVTEVAERVAGLGADMMNCIPLYPVEGTVFGKYEEPSVIMMSRLRYEAAQFLPQMRHCGRCRADAVGFVRSPAMARASQMGIGAVEAVRDF